jgi:nitrite reductase/ring-hydroxylating ferredoxin subunit
MAEFTTVGKASEVLPGNMKVFDVNGYAVTVANVGGDLRAFQDECTHQTCSLGEGDIEGEFVICLCHNAEFDMRTGEPHSGPATIAVPVFDVRVEGDDIQVAL